MSKRPWPGPGESDSAATATLFDRQLPTYLPLPPMPDGAGQVVVTAGDARLLFDPPNDRARFFDFGVSREGLVVTVC